MQDLTRASDLTSAMATIKALNETLADLKADLAEWKVEFNFEVVQPSLDLRITARKGNGSGLTQIVPLADIEYFAADPEALVAELTEIIFVNLMKNTVKNAITAPITRSIKNIMLMKDKA